MHLLGKPITYATVQGHYWLLLPEEVLYHAEKILCLLKVNPTKNITQSQATGQPMAPCEMGRNFRSWLHFAAI